jgi:hypothetical protein
VPPSISSLPTSRHLTHCFVKASASYSSTASIYTLASARMKLLASRLPLSVILIPLRLPPHSPSNSSSYPTFCLLSLPIASKCRLPPRVHLVGHPEVDALSEWQVLAVVDGARRSAHVLHPHTPHHIQSHLASNNRARSVCLFVTLPLCPHLLPRVTARLSPPARLLLPTKGTACSHPNMHTPLGQSTRRGKRQVLYASLDKESSERKP